MAQKSFQGKINIAWDWTGGIWGVNCKYLFCKKHKKDKSLALNETFNPDILSGILYEVAQFYKIQ